MTKDPWRHFVVTRIVVIDIVVGVEHSFEHVGINWISNDQNVRPSWEFIPGRSKKRQIRNGPAGNIEFGRTRTKTRTDIAGSGGILAFVIFVAAALGHGIFLGGILSVKRHLQGSHDGHSPLKIFFRFLTSFSFGFFFVSFVGSRDIHGRRFC